MYLVQRLDTSCGAYLRAAFMIVLVQHPEAYYLRAATIKATIK